MKTLDGRKLNHEALEAIRIRAVLQVERGHKGKKYDKKKEQKEEEKPSEGTGKEEHHGMTTWICPGCGTRYTGWSELNRCSKCGYEEK